MTKIFISYRRDDTESDTGRIYDRLVIHFGKDAVFMDVDTIPFGVDFVEHLNKMVSQCDILLAMIGKDWLNVQDGQGLRRLDDPDDFVRIEIHAALDRKIPVIPVLIGKTTMPKPDQLPDVLKALSRRNAAEVRSGRDFHPHVDRLIRGIELVLQQDGEYKLNLVVRQAMDRTQGEPTSVDRHVADLIAKQHGIISDRATQIIDEAQEQWRKANSPKLKRKPGEIFANSLGMKFAWIPSGSFLMGSPTNEEGREDYTDAYEAQHIVTLTNGFYMGIHLVTQEQWQAVMGNNPSNFKGDKNLPVEQVSWEDCQEFIQTLRDKNQKPYRLPTEAEWEFACRAGTKTPFCFGETISTDQANYDGNFFYGNGKKGIFRQKTTPVGSFPANAWGLHDMHGNLWERCADWYGDYLNKDVTDPQGPNWGEHRVLRGGSWYNSPVHCRSALRGRSAPGQSNNYCGFRLCFSADENG